MLICGIIDLKYFYASLGENGACDCPQ